MGDPSHADEAGSEVIHCTADAGMRNSLSLQCTPTVELKDLIVNLTRIVACMP